MEDERLIAFLYLLMRDHLPVGTVSRLVSRAAVDDEEPIGYSNIELQHMAARFGGRLAPGAAQAEQSAGAQAWLDHAPGRILEELNRERAESGHGLTLEELAKRVGWNVAKEDDVAEAGALVQSLYDRGYVQRDNAEGRILLTADGATALEAGVL